MRYCGVLFLLILCSGGCISHYVAVPFVQLVEAQVFDGDGQPLVDSAVWYAGPAGVGDEELLQTLQENTARDESLRQALPQMHKEVRHVVDDTGRVAVPVYQYHFCHRIVLLPVPCGPNKAGAMGDTVVMAVERGAERVFVEVVLSPGMEGITGDTKVVVLQLGSASKFDF